MMSVEDVEKRYQELKPQRSPDLKAIVKRYFRVVNLTGAYKDQLISMILRSEFSNKLVDAWM